jgi:hypothetical protein
MIPFVNQTLLALGPFAMFILLAILCGLIWLSLWLLSKGGWCAWLGWVIVAFIVAELAPLVFS